MSKNEQSLFYSKDRIQKHFLNKSAFLFTSLFFFFSISIGTAQVSLSVDGPQCADNIRVSFSGDNSSSPSTSWIGIYELGAENTNYLVWNYTGTRSGTVSLSASLNNGTYEARYFYNNSYVLEAQTTFTIEADCSNSNNNNSLTTLTCLDAGFDNDNDGITANNDCDDNNPNLPTSPGSSCDDGNPNTSNDRIQSDGCTCAGEDQEQCYERRPIISAPTHCENGTRQTIFFGNNGRPLRIMMTNAYFEEFSNGTARITGHAPGVGDVNVFLSSRTTNGIPVNPCGANTSDWYYYLSMSGTAGPYTITQSRTGQVFQVGRGAHVGRDINQYGASGWWHYRVGGRETNGEFFLNLPEDACCENPAKVFVGVDQVIEYGDPVSLSAQISGGATSVTWSAVGGDGSFSARNSINTTYTPGPNDIANGKVTIRATTNDVNRCGSAEDELTVYIRLPNPSANVNTTNAICGGEDGTISFDFTTLETKAPDGTTIEFSLDGGVTYQPEVLVSNRSITYENLSSGTYRIFVRWGNDECEVDLGAYTIGEDRLATPGTTCNDGNPNTINDVYLADGCTCQGQDCDLTIDLTTSQPLCKGETVTIDVIVNGQSQESCNLSYEWSNGQRTSSLVINEAGTYSVTVTDCLGCEAIGSINVDVAKFDGGYVEADVCNNGTLIITNSIAPSAPRGEELEIVWVKSEGDSSLCERFSELEAIPAEIGTAYDAFIAAGGFDSEADPTIPNTNNWIFVTDNDGDDLQLTVNNSVGACYVRCVRAVGCSEGFSAKTSPVALPTCYSHTITAREVSVNEASGIASIEICLNQPLSSPVFIDYTTSSGTATSDSDFQPTTAITSIREGSTCNSVTIPIVDDNEAEEEEWFSLHLTTDHDEAYILDREVIIRIEESDKISMEAAINNTTVNEEDGLIDVEICLDQVATEAVSFDFTTDDISANEGTDYQLNNGVATIEVGQICTGISIQIINDEIEELTESFAVTITNTTNNATITKDRSIVTILDTDEPTLPRLSIDDMTVNEEDGRASLEVCLNEPATKFVYMSYKTVNGSAIGGEDYRHVSSYVFINRGQQCRTITLHLSDDEIVEETETFTVQLSRPFNAQIEDGEATITIMDSDATQAAPQLSISDVTVNEEENAVVEVCLQEVSNKFVYARYETVSGSATDTDDFIRKSSYIFIPRGRRCASINVSIQDDNEEEATEEFRIVLSRPFNAELGDEEAIVTILDSDESIAAIPNISVSNVSVFEGVGVVKLDFCLDRAASVATSVRYTTIGQTAQQGIDFNSSSGVIDIAPGDSCASVTVSIIDDSENESLETFMVNLSNPVNVNIIDDQGVITILDNDQASTALIDPCISANDLSVNEGERTANLQLCLNEVSTEDVRVQYATSNGTANAGEDFRGVTNDLIIPTGQQCTNITFDIIDDNVGETTERFLVTLSNPVNAVLCDEQVTITIEDNDEATTPECPEASINGGEDNIRINNLTAPIEVIQVINELQQTIFQCANECNDEEIVSNLPAGKYQVKINFYNASWSLICREEQTITIGQSSRMGNNYSGQNTGATSSRSSLENIAIPQEKTVSINTYPNPVVDLLTIDMDNELSKKIRNIYLRSNTGQIVREVSLDALEYSATQLLVSDLPNGLYYLTIMADGQLIHTDKIIIQR